MKGWTVAIVFVLLAGACVVSSIVLWVRQRSWAKLEPLNVTAVLPFTEGEQYLYVQRGSVGLARYSLSSGRLQVLVRDRWMLADMSDDERVMALNDQAGNVAIARSDGAKIVELPKLVPHWGSPRLTRDGSSLAVPRSADYGTPEEARPPPVSDIYVFDTTSLEPTKLAGKRNEILQRVEWARGEGSLLAYFLRKAGSKVSYGNVRVVRLKDHATMNSPGLATGLRAGIDYEGFDGEILQVSGRAFMEPNCPQWRVEWKGTVARIIDGDGERHPIEFEHLGGNVHLWPTLLFTLDCGYVVYTTNDVTWMTEVATAKSRRLLEGWYPSTHNLGRIQVRGYHPNSEADLGSSEHRVDAGG